MAKLGVLVVMLCRVVITRVGASIVTYPDAGVEESTRLKEQPQSKAERSMGSIRKKIRVLILLGSSSPKRDFVFI
jgi:hypothetical protein